MVDRRSAPLGKNAIRSKRKKTKKTVVVLEQHRSKIICCSQEVQVSSTSDFAFSCHFRLLYKKRPSIVHTRIGRIIGTINHCGDLLHKCFLQPIFLPLSLLHPQCYCCRPLWIWLCGGTRSHHHHRHYRLQHESIAWFVAVLSCRSAKTARFSTGRGQSEAADPSVTPFSCVS